jgi:hypothetical protein
MLGLIAAFCPSYCKLHATLLFRCIRDSASRPKYSFRVAHQHSRVFPVFFVDRGVRGDITLSMASRPSSARFAAQACCAYGPAQTSYLGARHNVARPRLIVRPTRPGRFDEITYLVEEASGLTLARHGELGARARPRRSGIAPPPRPSQYFRVLPFGACTSSFRIWNKVFFVPLRLPYRKWRSNVTALRTTAHSVEEPCNALSISKSDGLHRIIQSSQIASRGLTSPPSMEKLHEPNP